MIIIRIKKLHISIICIHSIFFTINMRRILHNMYNNNITMIIKVSKLAMSLHTAHLLSFIFNEEFWICLASLKYNKLTEYQPQVITFMRANNRVERRLMRLVGAVIFVTTAPSARRLSEWCWFPTDEHVAEHYADNEHEQRRAAVSALFLRIWQHHASMEAQLLSAYKNTIKIMKKPKTDQLYSSINIISNKKINITQTLWPVIF